MVIIQCFDSVGRYAVPARSLVPFEFIDGVVELIKLDDSSDFVEGFIVRDVVDETPGN